MKTLVIILLLVPVVVSAQTADLIKAYEICESLPGVSPLTKRFPVGYERCVEIRARWWASPQGKAILEEQKRQLNEQRPAAAERPVESETERNDKEFLKQLK